MVRWLFTFAMVIAALAPALAARAPDERRAEIAAATGRAVDNLMVEIGAARIALNLTVDEFLKQTGGSDRLRNLLERSQQIGGPRWIDDQTCQVKLEASGETVAALLLEIASADPQRSPLPPDVLARELRGWTKRSFTATGTSVSPKRLDWLRPQHQGAWAQIDQERRRDAIAAARVNAVRAALQSVQAIALNDDLTIADLLADPLVAQQMNEWFARRPVKSVTFTDNLEVRISLSASPDETFAALMSAARSSGAIPLPADQTRLDKAQSQFIEQMRPLEGHASVTVATQDPPQPAVELPRQPPQWVSEQIDAEGFTRSIGRPLATQHLAQERALDNLRTKIGLLPLSDGTTLDDAARQDVRIADALDRAMVRARVFKVTYDPEGGVLVRVTLDARDIWDQIIQSR